MVEDKIAYEGRLNKIRQEYIDGKITKVEFDIKKIELNIDFKGNFLTEDEWEELRKKFPK